MRISEIKAIRKAKIPVENLFEGIKINEKTALGRAITLAESNNQNHRIAAQDLIERCLTIKSSSIRVGITGVPGVGKSTFIETLGKNLTVLGNKVAVLAVDPTSTKNKGSILGDKTRMQQLSLDPNAFIRPSPAGESLGGVAQKTKEAIIICEAAGYDIILVETVGVGQSEVAVHNMVDFFLVLKLSGAGDELQGIKRGILELADAVVINKADGNNITAANMAVKEFTRALHLNPAKENGWVTKVIACSAIENSGIQEIWTMITNYIKNNRESGYFDEHRNEQNKFWLIQTIENRLIENFYQDKAIQSELENQLKKVSQGRTSPFNAAEKLLNLAKKHTD
ncbi:methylmalonyl Co-A mutase-associated GTPase MeaB [Aurantibacter crassamenti]|uniref:methylmalonyl Co-A mutase-associated GTPase MeaB n=1 Tax=Aurantibacter crassamenti TaxID=1837375 RepID=UPI001EEEE65A|nr:methylmalonyl Co-A mutase-associated GTPase MeaB [Aurantibacter crassamenti]